MVESVAGVNVYVCVCVCVPNRYLTAHFLAASPPAVETAASVNVTCVCVCVCVCQTGTSLQIAWQPRFQQ